MCKIWEKIKNKYGWLFSDELLKKSVEGEFEMVKRGRPKKNKNIGQDNLPVQTPEKVEGVKSDTGNGNNTNPA